MKRKISLIISFCIIVAVFVLGFFILRGKSKTSPTDNEQRFSSQEECREYVDSTFSFEWEEEWKRQGFIYCYCEDCELTEENRNILRENDYDILSLFPCYFDASFASNEEIETARKIAGLLTGYIVKTHGEDIFKTCSSSDYINEWLGTTDLGITYEDPFAANIGCYGVDTDLYCSFGAITERGEDRDFKP